MSVEDELFEEQLLAYVYDALEGDALRSFEQGLAESPARVAALRATEAALERARTGFAVLDAAPPPQMQAALVAAAHAETQRREREALVQIRRRRWTYRAVHWGLPSLGVAAAVGLVSMVQREPPNAPPARERDEQPVQPTPAGSTPPTERATAAAAGRGRAGADETPERTSAEGPAEAPPSASASAPEGTAVGAEALVYEAQALHDAGRFEEAARAYQVLLTRHPRDPRAAGWRAQRTRALEALGDDAFD